MGIKLKEDDYEIIVNKSVNFIKYHWEEQFENFMNESGDIYDEYLSHCTLDAHRDDLLKFIRRSTMFKAESLYCDYIDSNCVQKANNLVLERLDKDYFKVDPIIKCLKYRKYKMFFEGFK